MRVEREVDGDQAATTEQRQGRRAYVVHFVELLRAAIYRVYYDPLP